MIGSKDLSDSLAGSIYSASLHITSTDLADMDNFSILMQANQVDYVQDFSENPVNAMFNMSVTPKNPQINELSIDEEEKRSKEEETKHLKELRSHLSEQENKQISNKELLDLYSSQFEDDDMIIF